MFVFMTYYILLDIQLPRACSYESEIPYIVFIDWIQMESEPGLFVELSLERDEILPSRSHMTALTVYRPRPTGLGIYSQRTLYSIKKTRK